MEPHSLIRKFDFSRFKNEKAKYANYLIKEAFRDHESNIGRVFLFIYKPDNEIAGYVALAMSNLPRKTHMNLKGLTNYPDVPALLLGQMARNLDYAHMGMGRYMLDWVIDHGIKLSKEVGCRIIMLNSEKDKINWYYENGFTLIDHSNN
ncbi:MAG TPA: GNAT family N-acetyltransferase, partial [Nitrososphaeraceae archaeon]|nr:GNAT family N-acetyltransferase [Nitrososphaeraceae archaeon]